MALVASARGPLPKKIREGRWAASVEEVLVVIREELAIIFNLSVVVDRVEFAFVVHAVEGFFVIFDVVDEEDAIEVIDFVLKSASEKIFGFNADRGAIFELGFDADFVTAGNFTIEKRYGETTFVVGDDFAVGLDDLWVQESGKMVVVFVVEVVSDDNYALVDAELRGGHSGGELVRVFFFPSEAFGTHGGDSFSYFGVVNACLGRFLAQTRVWGSNNFRFHCL